MYLVHNSQSAIALSSLLPSCSSCLRGSFKKDAGEKCDPLRSLREIKKGYLEVEGVR